MSESAMPTMIDNVKTSPNLTLSLDRAQGHARDLRHREVGVEHLLLALTDDPDATGSLEACGVDLARLKTDIATHVSKNAGAEQAQGALEPVLSAELRRLLDQSFEAAHEAKRKDINSFIVLAAIVGEEKSEAATILEAHGFTFMEAIEALRPRLPRAEDAKAHAGLIAPVPKTAAGPASELPAPSPPPTPTLAAVQPPAPPSQIRPPRAPSSAPTAAKMEEALAQSADALPPLPSARSARSPVAPSAVPARPAPAPAPPQAERMPPPPPATPPRPAPQAAAPVAPAAKSIAPSQSAADAARPAPSPSFAPPPPPVGPQPSPDAGGKPNAGRGQPQSIDDMMASVRDKITPQRPQSQRPAEPAPQPTGAPAPLAPQSTLVAQNASLAPAPAGGAPRPSTTADATAAVPHRRPPEAAPAATARPPVDPTPPASQPPPQARRHTDGPPGAARRSGPEAFDLGAPMPVDRIARQPAQAPAPGLAAQRREPVLGAPPTAAPRRDDSAPGRHQGPMPPPMPAPIPTQTVAARQGMARGPGQGPGQSVPAAPPTAGMTAGSATGAGQPSGTGQRRSNLDAVDAGQLAEAIPRRMRLMVPATVEVRIARKNLEGLAAGIEGRGQAARHANVVTSALALRLKAPDGGFAIDGLSPETQWIENRLNIVSGDEFASWRWVVRPLHRGRGRLQLVVSARTTGPDGGTAETALPDQMIDVRVRTNWGLTAMRWTGWIIAAIIGGALAKFGAAGYEIVRRLAGW